MTHIVVLPIPIGEFKDDTVLLQYLIYSIAFGADEDVMSYIDCIVDEACTAPEETEAEYIRLQSIVDKNYDHVYNVVINEFKMAVSHDFIIDDLIPIGRDAIAVYITEYPS